MMAEVKNVSGAIASDGTIEHPSLYEAVVAALSEMDDVKASRKVDVATKAGGSYSYRYADLSDVLGYVRPILAKHGLVVAQSLQGDVGRASVVTWIIHGSGDRLEFGPLTMESKGTAQDAGSAYTYCRRYALLAAMGLATEDDDGQQASKGGRQSGGEQRAAAPTSTAAAAGAAFRTREEAQIMAAVDALEDLPRAQFAAEFQAEFGGPLDQLPKLKHAQAWQWTREKLGVA